MMVLLISLLNNLPSWAGYLAITGSCSPTPWFLNLWIPEAENNHPVTTDSLSHAWKWSTGDWFIHTIPFQMASEQSLKLPVNGIMTGIPRLFQFFSVTHCSNPKLLPWDSPVLPPILITGDLFPSTKPSCLIGNSWLNYFYSQSNYARPCSINTLCPIIRIKFPLEMSFPGNALEQSTALPGQELRGVSAFFPFLL